MRKGIVIFIYCLLFTVYCNGQSKKDSLLDDLRMDGYDTTRLLHLNKLAWEYFLIGEYDSALYHTKQAKVIADVLLDKIEEKKTREAIRKSQSSGYNTIGAVAFTKGDFKDAMENYSSAITIRESLGDLKGVAACLGNIASIQYSQGNYAEALKNYSLSLKKYEQAGHKPGISSATGNIGLVYYDLGNFPTAIKYQHASLQIKEELGDKRGMAISLNNIGNVYSDQYQHEKAMENYMASLKLEKEIGNRTGEATSYVNIGTIQSGMGNNEEALKNYFVALKIKEELGEKMEIARIYHNIASVYADQKKYAEALEYAHKALELRVLIEDFTGIPMSQNNIAFVLMKTRKYEEARSYLNKALVLAKELQYKECLRGVYQNFADLDEIEGKHKSAFENYKMYVLYRDSLNNQEDQNKILRSQMTYDFEKKEAVAEAEHKIELQNQELLAEEKSRKQRLVLIFVLGSLLLVLVFAGFIFRSLRTTRKQKNIIEQQKNIVEQQKQEVELQKLIVEEHQKEIIDSITYARRIQRSLLPTERYIERNLKRLKQ